MIMCINIKKRSNYNKDIILSRLNNINNHNNIVLAGDYNIDYKTCEYNDFIKSLNLTNIQLNSDSTQCPYCYRRIQIDYFMYNKLINYDASYSYILKMKYNNEYNNNRRLEDITGSDHFAIETRLIPKS